MTASAGKIAFAVIVGALSLACAAFAEGNVRYGQTGTVELGFAGSFVFSFIDFTVTVAGSPTPQTFYTLSPGGQVTVKYYLFENFHIGGMLYGEYSFRLDESGALSEGDGSIILFASAGYALPITPGFLVDMSVMPGICFFNVWQSRWDLMCCPGAGVEVMLLFPVLENVVLGFGCDGYLIIETNPYARFFFSGAEYDGIVFCARALFQISVYF